jgi:HEAT repeat protein
MAAGFFIIMAHELLSDSSAEVRFWSAFTLGSLGSIEALPELTRLTQTDHTLLPAWGSISQEAANALANIQRAREA